MARLALFFLGAPRIEYEGRPVAPDTRKAVALIAYLAMSEGKHTRDKLAALLWPEYDQTRSRAALRRTLSALKKAVSGYALLIERESLAFDSSADVLIDAAEFQSQLEACDRHGRHSEISCPTCLVNLTGAVALYRDDFMAGFSLRDSVTFDEWQYLEGESLRRELAGAHQFLVRCFISRGEYSTAIDYARRLLDMDPLDEPAHRQLMIAYSWSGQRTAALRQYRECVRILEEELGVGPLEETTALYEQIVRGDLIEAEHKEPGLEKAAAVVAGEEEIQPELAKEQEPIRNGSQAPARPKERPGPVALPLVGRTAEWNRLISSFVAGQDDGRLVVVEGEAGIGKTRLAQTLVTSLVGEGRRVIVVQCFAGESGLAYGPLIEGLRAAILVADQDWYQDLPPFALAETSRLLPELAQLGPELPVITPLDSPGAQSRFFEGIRQAILALNDQEQPGLLFVDDVHWADEATIEFLAYLARRLHGQPLFMLLTWRSEDTVPEHRLHQVLSDGQRAGTAEVIRLDRLNAAAVNELVQAAAAGIDYREELAQRLYTETEGLPFFLVEYLSDLSVSFNQAEVTGFGESLPAMAPDGRPTNRIKRVASALPIPSSVRDLIHSRLATVSETGRQLLQTAAIIGRSFDFDTLRGASGRTEEETVIALEELIARALVTESVAKESALLESITTPSSSPQYDFTHEKIRTLVYEESSLARRRLLHRRAAQALIDWPAGQTKTTASGPPAAAIAYHFQHGGQEQAAAEYYYLAGDAARILYANAEALNHFTSALTLGHPETALLREVISDLQVLRGEYGAALTGYEAAAIEADEAVNGTVGDDFSRLQQKLGSVYHRLGEWKLAAYHFEAALARLADPVRRSRLLTDWSLTAHRAGQDEEALTLAQEALDLATEAADTQALAQSHNILGILASSRGDQDTATQQLQQSLELAKMLADPDVQIAAMNNLARAYGAAGDLEQALALANEALAMCADLGDRHHEAALHNNQADLLHANGRSEDAMGHLKQSAIIYAEIGGDLDQWRPEIWKLDAW